MFRFVGAAARLVFAAFAIFAFSAAAGAQYITYVATNGNDANPCVAVTAPCKTLQRTVNVTPANGTVRVLTPLQSSVFINKNVTISGDGVPIVGQFTIAGATAVVRLSGLALNGVGGYVNGIRIDSAAAVHIENCTVERYTGDGIKLVATTDTSLFVADTVVLENGGNGLYASDVNSKVAIENSRFEKNTNAGVNLTAEKVNISGSLALENEGDGIRLSGNANITETTVAENDDGFVITAGFVTLTSSGARGNGNYGLYVSPGSAAVISNSVFTLKYYGVLNNGGTLYTRQNNTNNGNVTDYSGTAAVVAGAL